MTTSTEMATSSSGACPPCEELLNTANLAVLRALELAGRRMVPRSEKRFAPDVPVYERHTALVVELADLDRLISGAWDMLTVAMPDRPSLVDVLDAYTREALYAGRRHTLADLRDRLAAAGLAEG